jgi:uncharacterized DUF497 family protein
MEFEWDENKRAANLAKHGLDLVTGTVLFDGRPRYTYVSPRSGSRGSFQSLSLEMSLWRWCGPSRAPPLV